MKHRLFPCALLVLTCAITAFGVDSTGTPANVDWPAYLGDKARTLYSPLKQINRDNVAKLKLAWTYDTGDKGEYQSNNLIIGGVLYTASPTRKVIALDAATGKEMWTWDPKSEGNTAGRSRERGLVFWQNDTGAEQRIFTGVGNRLYAIDAKTGRTIRSFGENGSIHLGSGLDTPTPPNVGLNTPGLIYKDMLIIGGFGGPGAMRAFDVHTGARRWVFHLIPKPGEVGYDTWPPEKYKTATGLMPWCGQSLDEARGILYVATKTAEPDFYGGERHGWNLFANCLVALDANTGKRLWHYQIVHHDMLDRDLPCPPVLLTVMHDGKKVDAVAQGTKQGLLFVFDRVTGAPLWPIEEKPVPKSELRGEEAPETQPFPTKPVPLTREHIGLEDVSILPEDAIQSANRILSSPNVGPFPAPNIKEAIMFPGFDGGMEWGGGAADPDGIYYVNVNEVPWLMQMVEARNADGTPLEPGKKDYLLNCAACHGLDRKGNPAGGFPTLIDIDKRKTREQIEQVTRIGGGRMPAFDKLSDASRKAILDYVLGVTPPPAATGRTDEGPAPAPAPGAKDPPYAFAGFKRWLDAHGYPMIKPPWGTLNAVDLNTGEIKWKVPLGEYAELTAQGIPPTGTENYGGPVVTAGGLIFIGATADETMRAFDKDTGKVLWQAKLPFGGNATPSTYVVNGRQYVVISAGGSKSGRPAGGSIVAFALPETN